MTQTGPREPGMARLDDPFRSKLKPNVSSAPYKGPKHVSRAAQRNGRFDFKTVFSEMKLEEPEFFFLNDYKNHRSWSPYQQFTLSIEKEGHLYDFVHQIGTNRCTTARIGNSKLHRANY